MTQMASCGESEIECDMSVRVFRKDGTVEELKGDAVIDIDALIAEHKRAVAYCHALENLMKQIPGLRERMR